MISNGILLLTLIILIVLLKFILWTYSVHRHNIKLKEKLGDQVYDWVIYGNETPKPELFFDEDVSKLAISKANEIMVNAGERMILLSISLKKANEAFYNFGKAVNKIGRLRFDE